MALITRTYTFTDGTTAYGSQVDSEIANIVNTLNNLDSGANTWTNVKVTTLLPQADVNAGGHKITNLGTPTTSGDAIGYGQSGWSLGAGSHTGALAMGSNKITSLANGTSTTDAAAFGQVTGTRILQTVQFTGGAQVTTTSSSYVSTNITTSITPASTSSKVKISVCFTAASGGNNLVYSLFRGSTDLGDSVGGFGNVDGAIIASSLVASCSLIYLDSPASSSAVTYTLKFKAGASGGGGGIPAGAGPSSSNTYGFPTMLLEEIG